MSRNIRQDKPNTKYGKFYGNYSLEIKTKLNLKPSR